MAKTIKKTKEVKPVKRARAIFAPTEAITKRPRIKASAPDNSSDNKVFTPKGKEISTTTKRPRIKASAPDNSSDDKVFTPKGKEISTTSTPKAKAEKVEAIVLPNLEAMESKTDTFVHTSASPKPTWEIEAYIKSLNSNADVETVGFSNRQAHFNVTMDGKTVSFPGSGHYTVKP